jgi:hypothetical protein
MMVCIGCILLSVVTCVFLLNKLGYFTRRYKCFALLLPMGTCYLAWAVLIFIFCDRFLGYVLVLFLITIMMLAFSAVYWFSCWGVICCFSCSDVVLCRVVDKDYYWLVINILVYLNTVTCMYLYVYVFIRTVLYFTWWKQQQRICCTSSSVTNSDIYYCL